MYCIYCGAENPAHGKFCKACGKSLAEIPAETGKGKRRIGIILLCLTALLILALGIVLIFLLGEHDDESFIQKDDPDSQIIEVLETENTGSLTAETTTELQSTESTTLPAGTVTTASIDTIKLSFTTTTTSTTARTTTATLAMTTTMTMETWTTTTITTAAPVYSSTTTTEINVQSAEIYSILVLDISGSMAGDAIIAEREAAVKFCENILKYNSDSHIAIVALGSGSDIKILSDFSSDLTQLTSIINNIDAYSGTEYTPALQLADDLLSTVPDTYPRSIVLCSDGDPFDSTAANALAESLKDKYTIYTLGFFHTYEATGAREILNNLATNEYCYYQVEDPDYLTEQFAMIANNVAFN